MPDSSSSSRPEPLDLERWRRSVILKELHQQWVVNRGVASTVSAPSFQRPFSRDWERLLDDAGVRSAEDRREAERDVRTLSELNLLQLRFVPHRPHLIERVIVPLASQDRLRELFPGAATEPEPDLAQLPVAWEPELHFLTHWRVGISGEELLQLNRFFAEGGRARPVVPIKERSLELFGDEKRLDVLASTALFRPGRLSLAQLRCEVVGEPFGWAPGRRSDGPVLIVENAATWHSFMRWNQVGNFFRAVIYGCGNKTADHVRLLSELVGTWSSGTPARVLYFGDLDPQGVRIPVLANLRIRDHGLPMALLEPDLWSYQHLLKQGRGHAMDADQPRAWGGEELSWLGTLAEDARRLWEQHQRVPQEYLGWEFLSSQSDRSMP